MHDFDSLNPHPILVLSFFFGNGTSQTQKCEGIFPVIRHFLQQNYILLRVVPLPKFFCYFCWLSWGWILSRALAWKLHSQKPEVFKPPGSISTWSIQCLRREMKLKKAGEAISGWALRSHSLKMAMGSRRGSEARNAMIRSVSDHSAPPPNLCMWVPLTWEVEEKVWRQVFQKNSLGRVEIPESFLMREK